MTSLNKNIVFEQTPNIDIKTKEIFGVECEFKVQGFKEKNDYVPKIDANYKRHIDGSKKWNDLVSDLQNK